MSSGSGFLRALLVTNDSFTETLAHGTIPALSRNPTRPTGLAPVEETMELAERFPVDFVRQSLVPPGMWAPYPRIGDRAGWSSLSTDRKRAIVETAEPLLGTSWPELKATLFMEFQRTGNRRHYETASWARRTMLQQLVIAECVEHQGRFVDDIINGIWAICEESFWDIPAHNRYVTVDNFGRGGPLPDTRNPVVALFSAETGVTLAFVQYLLGEVLDQVDPVITDRIQHEITARLLDPFVDRDDWWWLGLVQSPDHPGPPNNWNPWIISNLLSMVMLIEDDEDRRARLVYRCLRGLDQFLAGYHADGGCDEGITYWERAGAAVFDCLDLLDSATGGTISVWDEPLIAEMGRYVYRTHIGGTWYVNFADGSAKTVPAPNLAYHFGQRIGDDALSAHASAAEAEGWTRDHGFHTYSRLLRGLFQPIPAQEPAAAYPLVLQSWLDGIEVLIAREAEGSERGLFLAAKGGNNGESHNHNDVGSFIVGLDGQPVLIDVGVGEYTKQTFSDQRYELWTMQSAYHNVPVINGHQQSPGPEFAARNARASLSVNHAELTLEIAGAWPDDAGVERWERTFLLERGENAAVIIEDDWALQHASNSLALVLMAAGAVDLLAPGTLRLTGPERPLTIDYDASLWIPALERIDVDDSRLTPVWGAFVSRILLTSIQPPATGRAAIRIQV